MQTTQLGSTSIRVSALGLGAMHLSLSGRPPEDEALQVLHRALDLGITFIDTADSYCRDESDKHHNERLIRKALGTYDGSADRVVVATKGGLMRPEGRWTRNGDPGYLLETIRESYEVLGGERPITLWQHHAPDGAVPVTESLLAAKEAVEEGLVQHVGVSNYSVEQIEEAREIVEVVSVQNQYSLWHRAPEKNGVLQYCEDEGLTFLPWSPLGGSARSKDVSDGAALAKIAEAKGVSPQRIALAWLMAQSSCVLPIPGATRPASVEDSAQAPGVTLSAEERERIVASA